MRPSGRYTGSSRLIDSSAPHAARLTIGGRGALDGGAGGSVVSGADGEGLPVGGSLVGGTLGVAGALGSGVNDGSGVGSALGSAGAVGLGSADGPSDSPDPGSSGSGLTGSLTGRTPNGVPPPT
ncbi:hypothetical protein [Streptomyces alkaliterrae]|uniref:hypothetical protein n=1 Tax=Streptomyces alkaliterrae TaxID=2213162 RepID=UPI002B20DD9A|nr:hypothetical protein [Streptomyces alkaliterrae]